MLEGVILYSVMWVYHLQAYSTVMSSWLGIQGLYVILETGQRLQNLRRNW